jgi:hypothetical protein
MENFQNRKLSKNTKWIFYRISKIKNLGKIQNRKSLKIENFEKYKIENLSK